MKALDLRRDPRVAIHSPSDEPDEANPGAWSGDAKLAGRAVEITDPAARAAFGLPAGDESHLFRVDVTEVVFTCVDEAGEHLVIEMWHEGSGHRVVRRR